jgi:serralysin
MIQPFLSRLGTLESAQSFNFKSFLDDAGSTHDAGLTVLEGRGSASSVAPLAASAGNFFTAFQPAFDLATQLPDHQVTLLCGCPSCMKALGFTAFQKDGVGDGKVGPDITPSLDLTVDEQPGNTTTTSTISADGAHVISTLETPGDFDFFKVDLVDGQLYNIGQYLVTGGPGGVPLADAYIELYDNQGNLIVSADGGGPNTPSGLDALLTYEAEYTGTYYINARAYDNGTPGGFEGDFVGDYELFVDSVAANDPTAYRPLYTPDSPLHSIDWGSQVDRTSRNPDGDNGPRDNGAPNTGVTYNATYDISGKNVITYYFAKTGDVFLTENPLVVGSTDNAMVAEGWTDWEMEAMRTALDQYEQVTDNVYIEVQNRADADFKFITYEGTPGVGASLLGRMSPPNENNEGQAEFNAGDARWTEEGLQQGGFYFPTLVHELGHGHGMAHPHDNGGRSSIMRGSDDGSVIGGALADYNLSQQVFTVMSYNDGWQTSPYGMPRSGGITGTEVDHFGWVASLSALDIAVMQDKYGVNEEWATGNDVYTLKDVNAPGTFYETIWDAGGTDEINYVGAKDATIDLRDATLQYEEGGGGWMSYAYGIHGGFTIANAVTIENATGGNGNDMLVGNEAANVLTGGAGNDSLTAGDGNDVLHGGAGADNLAGGAGDDVLYVIGNDESLIGDAGYDQVIVQDAAGVSVTVGSGVEYVLGSTGNDALSATGLATQVSLHGGLGNDTLTGGTRGDWIDGGSGDDQLKGGANGDTMFGGAGNDTLFGGTGNDQFTLGLGNDVCVIENGSGNDSVMDFVNGSDIFDFSEHLLVNTMLDLTISTSGTNAIVAFAGGQLTVFGAAGLIDTGDFAFV